MCVCVYVFFFKQKTAYEWRISDWSSDVCSSDLTTPCRLQAKPAAATGLDRHSDASPHYLVATGRLGFVKPLIGARHHALMILARAAVGNADAAGHAQAGREVAAIDRLHRSAYPLRNLATNIEQIGRAHV